MRAYSTPSAQSLGLRGEDNDSRDVNDCDD